MNNSPDATRYPVEGLIALFKASEIWSDYRAASEVPGCPNTAEVVLRERWIQQWPHQRLFASWEDDRSRQLSFLEQEFFKIFAELGRNHQVEIKHRILSKHHPTAEHYSTPPEMFDNVGITVDRGEILMQTSGGPCVKLVQINYKALTTSTTLPSPDVGPAPPPSPPQTPLSLPQLVSLARRYHQQCTATGQRPSITTFAHANSVRWRRGKRAFLAAGLPLPGHGGARR